jgi:hypothetical protein
MKPNQRVLAAAAFVFVLTGCTALARSGPNREIKAYRGDGNLSLLSRHYGPGMETYGYILDLPPFTPTENLRREYSLAGLPLWERSAQVEIVTFLPERRMSAWEASQIAPVPPEEHLVSCRVIDTKTGAVVAENEASISELAATTTLYFHRANFVRHILSIDLRTLTSTADLVLEFACDVGDSPSNEKMLLVVIVDAPTA